MDENANSVVYFYGLSAVRVIPLAEIRSSSLDDQKIFHKTLCFATMKGEEQPCVVLTVEHGKSNTCHSTVLSPDK